MGSEAWPGKGDKHAAGPKQKKRALVNTAPPEALPASLSIISGETNLLIALSRIRTCIIRARPTMGTSMRR